MTSTEGLGEDNVLDGVFDRETPQETVVDTPNTDGKSNRDELGRFTAKSPPEPAEQAQPEPAPIEPQAQPDPNASRHVPLSELLSERKQRQEKERLYIEAEARAKAYEQMLQRQPQQHQPQPQQQQVEAPDPYTDPQGWAQHFQNQLVQQQRAEMLFLYEDRVREKHGSDKVDAAFQAAQAAGMLEQIKSYRDPWTALMAWNQQQTVQKEVGGDLEAYRKKVEEEVRQKVLAELKAGGANGQPAPKFPGSLANATGQGEQGAHLTIEAAVDGIFASGRNRKTG